MLNHERDWSIETVMAKGWHAEDIKGAIRKRGRSLTALALENDLCESACRAALLRPQPAAEKVISEFLGVSLHLLWPDRYFRDGNRKPRRHVRDELNQNRAGAHGQIAGRA